MERDGVKGGDEGEVGPALPDVRVLGAGGRPTVDPRPG